MHGLAFIVVFLVTLAQAQAPPPAPSLANQIRTLGRELRIETDQDLPVFNRAVRRGGPEELDRLLRALTEEVLRANPKASAETLQRQLRAVYDPWGKWSEYTARAPEVFRATLGGRAVVIVTWLTWIGGAGSPRSHAHILACAEDGGRFAISSQAGSFLNDHGMFVVPVASREPRESWFVAYGVRFGSTHVDINVALLAFDGKQFQTRWSRENVGSGTVTFRPDGLRLEYVLYPAAGGPWDREVVEELTYTPTGLVTRSRTVKPPLVLDKFQPPR